MEGSSPRPGFARAGPHETRHWQHMTGGAAPAARAAAAGHGAALQALSGMFSKMPPATLSMLLEANSSSVERTVDSLLGPSDR